MNSINDIRQYIKIWSKQTYVEGLKYAYSIKNNEQVKNLTIEVLKIQKLDKKQMNGNSVQKIPLKNEGKVDVIFTDIFWELSDNYISPVCYIGAIVKKCIEKNIVNEKEVAGIVGRGLRALPSFIREMDLTYKMAHFFPGATVTNGPEQDVSEHTDVLIKTGNDEYRLWSYQNTERGLENTAKRFCGYRGKIPKGHYILCPIDIQNPIEVDEEEGWFFYSERYVQYLYEMMSIEKPDEYNTIVKFQRDALHLYIKKANVVIKRG